MFATKNTVIVPEIHGKQDANNNVNLGGVPNLELESGTTGAPGHIVQQNGSNFNLQFGRMIIPSENFKNSQGDYIGFRSIQKFTSTGTSTWTKPSGVNLIKVYVTGGGGGGGSHNNDDAQGGGGAGATAIKWIDVRAVSSVNVTVGSGGTGSVGSTSGGGGTGGTSSFGSYCSATGGIGVATWGVGGIGGTATGGDINLYGSDGQGGNIDGQGNEEVGGNGGESFWGGVGHGASYWGDYSSPRGWGCGGSGSHASRNNAGTDGMTGAVIIEEYV